MQFPLPLLLIKQLLNDELSNCMISSKIWPSLRWWWDQRLSQWSTGRFDLRMHRETRRLDLVLPAQTSQDAKGIIQFKQRFPWERRQWEWDHSWNSDTCPRDKLKLLTRGQRLVWFSLMERDSSIGSCHCAVGPGPLSEGRVQAAVTVNERCEGRAPASPKIMASSVMVARAIWLAGLGWFKLPAYESSSSPSSSRLVWLLQQQALVPGLLGYCVMVVSAFLLLRMPTEMASKMWAWFN